SHITIRQSPVVWRSGFVAVPGRNLEPEIRIELVRLLLHKDPIHRLDLWAEDLVIGVRHPVIEIVRRRSAIPGQRIRITSSNPIQRKIHPPGPAPEMRRAKSIVADEARVRSPFRRAQPVAHAILQEAIAFDPALADHPALEIVTPPASV